MSLKRIHLIAICGMGMGSLAGLLKEKGYEVSGSDQNIYPPMSDHLAKLGIAIHQGFRAEHLSPPPDLVVVGNAVSRHNPEVEAMLTLKLPYFSMPQAISELFLKERLPIVVAGTHGKTTTSALLAWLLEGIGQSPGFMVGGILKNFDGASRLGKGKPFVVEGDEYDSAFFDKGPKFLHYQPKILILNPIEFDHVDIYRDLAHLMTSFEALVLRLPSDGLAIVHAENSHVQSLLPRIGCRKMTFGISGTFGAEQIRLEEKTRFRLLHNRKLEGEVVSPLLGRHNVENLLAVIAVLYEWGVPLRTLNEALADFKGVKRRQEVVGSWGGITLIDDFAHHPTAIRETLHAFKSRYPQSRLWAIFEPRSNTTRRRIFQQQFPAAFAAADQVILGPVYQPEKIPWEERLDPAQIVEQLKKGGKSARFLQEVGEIVEQVSAAAVPGDILCIMSNGNFYGLIEKLKTRFRGEG